ncbi:MAG: hypothetical protein OES13_10200 [Acidimicrobiia bacterium]|nr:hypothetical protein [Acidimicrobiia bacterium]
MRRLLRLVIAVAITTTVFLAAFAAQAAPAGTWEKGNGVVVINNDALAPAGTPAAAIAYAASR